MGVYCIQLAYLNAKFCTSFYIKVHMQCIYNIHTIIYDVCQGMYVMSFMYSNSICCGFLKNSVWPVILWIKSDWHNFSCKCFFFGYKLQLRCCCCIDIVYVWVCTSAVLCVLCMSTDVRPRKKNYIFWVPKSMCIDIYKMNEYYYCCNNNNSSVGTPKILSIQA